MKPDIRDLIAGAAIIGVGLFVAFYAPSHYEVGEAARINECGLLTRDMRAKRTYDLLGVSYELIGLD